MPILHRSVLFVYDLEDFKSISGAIVTGLPIQV